MTIQQRLLPGVPPVESMLFNSSLEAMELSDIERNIALQLHENGFAIFDFPDDEINQKIARIKHDMEKKFDFEGWRNNGLWADNVGLRIQDAWKENKDVRSIATNPNVISLLSKLYGRRAFAFQTLNFPVGTQQHYHSDSIHFSSIPERFMCGVWLAMEDINEDAGPLQYYPGSHKWPIIYNDMIGVRVGSAKHMVTQATYEPVWKAMVEASGVELKKFTPKKGQALIWAANLLHGGSKQNDPNLTRWSQVTHYYFENCTYFTPAYSDVHLGNLALRDIQDVSTGEFVPNLYLGTRMDEARNLINEMADYEARLTTLPIDFSPDLYYKTNPDVLNAGVSAEEHYLVFGRIEGRKYK